MATINAIPASSIADTPRGMDLLDTPLLNKGTAFSAGERAELGLNGLLPPQVETLDEQALRAYQAFRRKPDDLERHVFLRALQDTNEVLFYKLVTVLPVAESGGPAGQATVASLEHTLLGSPHVIGVGGGGASLIDFDHAVYGDFPLMLAIIGVATFLLLVRAFRSVLLAAKAVVFNLISLAAAYGVLTWVWQDGHGSRALWGIPATGAITMWVPLMVFAFLFGLSMDYEVFILSRIREAYDTSGDARHAVVEGLGRTGRLVTSAAAILMLGFLSMSTGPQTDLKVLATGLGAGILIDAVIVRCLLVPALVALFGRANWWLPAPLARVLRIPASPAQAAEPASLASGQPVQDELVPSSR